MFAHQLAVATLAQLIHTMLQLGKAKQHGSMRPHTGVVYLKLAASAEKAQLVDVADWAQPILTTLTLLVGATAFAFSPLKKSPHSKTLLNLTGIALVSWPCSPWYAHLCTSVI